MNEQKDLTKKTRYNIQYAKEKIKRVPLDMQLTAYEALKLAADAAGEGVNTYIKKAIAARMEREQAGNIHGNVSADSGSQSRPAWEQRRPKQPQERAGDGVTEAGDISIFSHSADAPHATVDESPMQDAAMMKICHSELVRECP